LSVAASPASTAENFAVASVMAYSSQRKGFPI
jgi:hypothetical protein